jgi:germination protein M
MSSTREVLARAGIVKLFAQIPNIEYVKIYVEGEELKDSKGNSLSIMNGDTFLEYSGENLNSYQYAVINLYFTDQEGTALIPEEREVYYNSNVPLEQVVVEQLMKGPQQEGLYPTLPSNLTIMGVTRDGTNCYVNLDNTFISGAIATEESMIPVYSIVDSLAEDCQVEKVQISVNGETNVEFRDDIMLDGFFEKNTDLIRLQEESDQS